MSQTILKLEWPYLSEL